MAYAQAASEIGTERERFPLGDPDEVQLGKLAKRMLAMPPKKREESKLGKPRNPSQKRNELAKPREGKLAKKAPLNLNGARIGKIVADFILAAYPRIAPGAAAILTSPSPPSRRVPRSGLSDAE
jgi:hypothetical protein